MYGNKQEDNKQEDNKTAKKKRYTREGIIGLEGEKNVFIVCIIGIVKVKLSLQPTMKAHRGKSIAILFLLPRC